MSQDVVLGRKTRYKIGPLVCCIFGVALYFRSWARVVFNTFILQKRLLVGRPQLGSSVHFNLLFVTLCDLTLLATKKSKGPSSPVAQHTRTNTIPQQSVQSFIHCPASKYKVQASNQLCLTVLNLMFQMLILYTFLYQCKVHIF